LSENYIFKKDWLCGLPLRQNECPIIKERFTKERMKLVMCLQHNNSRFYTLELNAPINGLPQNRGGRATLGNLSSKSTTDHGKDFGIGNDPLFVRHFETFSRIQASKKRRNLTLNAGPRVGKLSSGMSDFPCSRPLPLS